MRFALALLILAIPAAPALAQGYDVIVVGGQSNAACYGSGPFSDPLQTPAIMGQIQQIGMYGSARNTLIPLADNVLPDPAPNDLNVVRSWETPQDWNYWPGEVGNCFAQAFAEAYAVTALQPGRQVILVSSACAGTSILSWLGQYIDPAKSCSKLLNYWMWERTNTALALPGDNRVVAVLWDQGEADASYAEAGLMGMTAQVYRGDLTSYVHRMRNEFAPSATFVMGHFTDAWTGADATKLAFESAIDNVCAVDGNCVVVPGTGQPDNYTSGASTDPAQTVHFDAQAKVNLGFEMFLAWWTKQGA